jgi:membrane fusion protein, multidrug efflux system
MDETMKKFIGIAVIGIIGVFLTLGILRSQETEEVLSIDDIQQREGIPIHASVVSQHDVNITRSFFGTIQAGNQTVVTSKLMERIESIHVEEGDWVLAGQVLVTFDTTASMASVSQARMQFENTRRDLARMEKLVAEGAISSQQYDQMKFAHEVAEKNYQTARNSVELIAPIAGIVSRIDFDEGDLAETGNPVVHIIDKSSYEIVFDVTQEDRPRLRNGQHVFVTLGNGNLIEGRISSISLSASEETRLFKAYADLPASEMMYPGVLASLSVVVDRAESVLAVPPDAILERGGERFVFTIRDNTTAVRQPVQRGLIGEEYIEILQGVQEGDWVATYGHNSLEDGALIKLVEESTVSASVE